MANKIISEAYDTIAPSYNEFVKKAQYSLPQWLHSTVQTLKVTRTQWVDLACGNGYVSQQLRALGVDFSYTLGIDLSSRMIEEANRFELYSKTIVQDLERGLPHLDSATVDLFTAFGLFEFIPDEYKLLTDIQNALKDEGELWCSFEAPLSGSEVETVSLRYGDSSFEKFRKSQFTIQNLLKAAQLQIISLEKWAGYVSPSSGETVNYFYVRAKKAK